MLNNRKSLSRKKYQRDLNKIVRNFNAAIKNDWLWNGRFTMRQYCSWFDIFKDHSGAQFNFILELKDNKTGRTDRMLFNNYNANWNIFRWANDIIVNDWNVWKEDPDPNKQARLEGRVPN